MTASRLDTTNINTWCPGCYNFLILECVKRAIIKLIEQGYKREDFAMAVGIGCHAKIFDYLNISGIYGLHGRVIPLCIGMKIGNPKLTVLGFSGDGDAYAEGMEHFIHAGRFNSNFTYIVHDNQTFALTTGQSTPTSQRGFKSKVEPAGEYNYPLNPIKLALASGATFIARSYPKDIAHTADILERAIKHKGFAYIEMIQPCLQFNISTKELEKRTYKIDNNASDMGRAIQLASEWDYDSKQGKIPLGIFYQVERTVLENKWNN